MRIKIIPGVFALALLVTAGFGVNKSMKSSANLSDLALMNVEALARYEDPDREKWSRMDLPCLDSNGNNTGKNQTICFKTGYLDNCIRVPC